MAKNPKLIVKSNYIIEASYKLSLGEQRVIYILTSMIDKDDEEFKPYKLTIKEFAEILGTKNKDLYSRVSQYVELLRERDLTIVREKSVLKTKWLSSAEYFVDEGYVELEFSPKLKPYLLMLKERFTKLSLDQMVSFTSQYSGRIYELLKQYEKIRERIFVIEDLKVLLGIEICEYKLYADFKRKVLAKAKNEINSNSDLKIEFEEIKTGRKVTSIKFYIKPNKKVQAPKENKVIDEIAADIETPLNTSENDIKLIMDITNNEFNKNTVKTFRDIANGDIDKIKIVYDYINTRAIDYNKAGYMRKALENWEEPKKGNGRGRNNKGFNNFEPRKIEERYLYLREQCLLGYATDEEREEFDKIVGIG